MAVSPSRPSPLAAGLHALRRPRVLDADFFCAGIPPAEAAAPRQAARRARSLYRAALREGRRQGPARGVWLGPPELAPADLAREVAQAEAAPAARVLKEDRGIRVVRAELLGRDVLIKRYDLARWRDRVRYLFRPSRARRFWAAARTLSRLEIPTPEPLGYVELRRTFCPVRSYVITSFLEQSSARAWLHNAFPAQPPAVREAIRRALLESLLTLYRQGIYHADTKASNLLLMAPTDDAARTFLWIDLECMRFGVVPTRHQIIRNLVQLNGSLGAAVREGERCAFLREMARTYPWVMRRRVLRKIRRWTAWRLERERRLPCGP